MIFRGMFYIAGTAADAFGCYTVMAPMPGAAAKINALAHDYVLGWSDDACSDNPLGCLQARYGTLSKLER